MLVFLRLCVGDHFTFCVCIGNGKQADVPNTTPQTTVPSINFINWEFCPGVPSPVLRIGIGNLPRRRSPISDVHVKKVRGCFTCGVTFLYKSLVLS